MQKNKEKENRIQSTKIAGVDCKIGRRSRTGSTVTMAVADLFILEAVKLYTILEKGEKPKEGLISIELHAVYALEDPEEAEKIMDDLQIDLDEVEETLDE